MPGLAKYPWQGNLAKRRGPATTMTKDDIQLLYEYDRWANNRLLQAVSALLSLTLPSAAIAAPQSAKGVRQPAVGALAASTS